MKPLCSSTIFLQMARPMPVPSYWFLSCRRLNIPKICSEYFCSKPMPLSSYKDAAVFISRLFYGAFFRAVQLRPDFNNRGYIGVGILQRVAYQVIKQRLHQPGGLRINAAVLLLLILRFFSAIFSSIPCEYFL